jgi:hypothetical protein
MSAHSSTFPNQCFATFVGAQRVPKLKTHAPAGKTRNNASPVRARINSRSNSASPPSTVSIKRPCAVVVSAHASARDRNPASLPVIAARVFEKVSGRACQPVEPRYHHYVEKRGEKCDLFIGPTPQSPNNHHLPAESSICGSSRADCGILCYTTDDLQ